MSSKKGLEVDRRVVIALDALAPGERLTITELLQSPERFASLAADPANVRSIKDADPQLFALRVSPRFRLVYQRIAEGRGYRVVDLVAPDMIGKFSTERPKKAMGGGRSRSRAPVRKADNLVEK